METYCKLFILGTLGVPGYVHPKWYYQLVENFNVYLQARKQLRRLCFSENIVKICKLLILDNLGKPGYTHPITCRKLRCFSGWQKKLHQLLSFEISILKYPTIGLTNNILAHNLRTRILPVMGLVVKYQ